MTAVYKRQLSKILNARQKNLSTFLMRVINRLPVWLFAILLAASFGLYACDALRVAKVEPAATPAKFSTVTFGQLKLRLPTSMVLPGTGLPVGFKKLAIQSQTGNHRSIRIGTLDNFQDKITQYIANGMLTESVQTFDEFFSELVNLVGTQNYPKLQKIMRVNTAISAKKYVRGNPTLYRFDFAKKKYIYIVFSNPKYVAEVYYLKGAISDADFAAIVAGIKS